MALIFLKVLIIFTGSSYEFSASQIASNLIRADEWNQFTQPQCTGL